MLTTALTIVHVILCVVLITIVLMQSGSEKGLSGSIGGGAETFFGKNGGRTLDALLAKCTSAVAVLFIVTSIVLTIIG